MKIFCVQNINSVQKYEGQHVYSIGSTMDEVVGHMICMEVRVLRFYYVA